MTKVSFLQNVAVLTLPDYQLVAAIVDTIIRMHEAGDIVSIELLSTGKWPYDHARRPVMPASKWNTMLDVRYSPRALWS